MIAMVLFRGSYGQVCVVTFFSSEIKQFDVFFLVGFFGYLLGSRFQNHVFLWWWEFLGSFFFHVFLIVLFVFMAFVNFGLELKQN